MEYTLTKAGVPEMSLFTEEQINELTRNGLLYANTHDSTPCVLLSGKKQVFILSEISISDPDKVYGLFYENNVPTLGYTSINLLNNYHENQEALYNRLSFNPHHKMSVFKEVADEVGRIVWDDRVLPHIFEKYSG